MLCIFQYDKSNIFQWLAMVPLTLTQRTWIRLEILPCKLNITLKNALTPGHTSALSLLRMLLYSFKLGYSPEHSHIWKSHALKSNDIYILTTPFPFRSKPKCDRLYLCWLHSIFGQNAVENSHSDYENSRVKYSFIYLRILFALIRDIYRREIASM